jgi:hypothetical protein
MINREAPMDIHARVGDEIVVDNMTLGHPQRTGQILEVLGEGDAMHYRVRWDDGHESLFFPGSTSHVVHLGAGS